jgi:hypothetical protein
VGISGSLCGSLQTCPSYCAEAAIVVMSSCTRPALTNRDPRAVVPSINPRMRMPPVRTRNTIMPSRMSRKAKPSRVPILRISDVHSLDSGS